MGKKKIALVDLSQSDTPQLKATGVRSQKLNIKKQQQPDQGAPRPMKEEAEKTPKAKDKSESGKKAKNRVKHGRSKAYLEAKALVDKDHLYPLEKAIDLLRRVSTVKFDATVEMHLNLEIDKLSGEMALPHGTGKSQKVEIASDSTITKLNTGKIDFDILIAEPKMMPKLAKYAKILGPKGLMPNPKTGTISDKPEDVKKKLSGGTIRYKSENKMPLMHLVVGKLSFKDKQLTENIKTVINTLKSNNIKAAFICSSMSPSIKLKVKS